MKDRSSRIVSKEKIIQEFKDTKIRNKWIDLQENEEDIRNGFEMIDRTLGNNK